MNVETVKGVWKVNTSNIKPKNPQCFSTGSMSGYNSWYENEKSTHFSYIDTISSKYELSCGWFLGQT